MENSAPRGVFHLQKNFGKFLLGVLGISVWEESVPFVTSRIRLQAPLRQCLGKLFCYFLERIFRRFPVKQMVMCGYEKSDICMFLSF